MAQQGEQMKLQIQHGTTPTQVYLGFSMPIPNLFMTAEECRSMIANLQTSLERLEQSLKLKAQAEAN